MSGFARSVILVGVLGASGCRCNSVDDHELSPAPSAAPAPLHSSSRPGTFTSEECGPDIGGVDAIANAPAILLGELHGLASAPAFTSDLACRLSLAHPKETVTLALELLENEQPRFDIYLTSDGKDRTIITNGASWNGVQDGRSSQARLEMIESIRLLDERGTKIRLVAIDNGKDDRDAVMANHIIEEVNAKRGPVIALIGNMHARTVSGSVKPTQGEKWAGEVVRAAIPNVVALDNRYSDGDAWICSPDCGRMKVLATDPSADAKWRIVLLPKPDEKGFAGLWHIGPARASEPAVR